MAIKGTQWESLAIRRHAWPCVASGGQLEALNRRHSEALRGTQRHSIGGTQRHSEALRGTQSEASIAQQP